MIINVTAWSVLDGSLVVQVALSAQDGLGIDGQPRMWRRIAVPAAGDNLATDRDWVAYLGEELINIAHE